jgi:hypothetical protein
LLPIAGVMDQGQGHHGVGGPLQQGEPFGMMPA